MSNEPSDGGEYNESSLEGGMVSHPQMGGDSEPSESKDDGPGDAMFGSDELCEVAGRYNGSL
eukprot:CAMPEP_0168243478 /NCGR_PEP_ID=MMETSP0140_2-20121125/24079_1 /TAXON_ID=44445 /ORGANISM="Pseudo-nitzschia australis, Strain 10249 10 AB" /LENGTH=61 /DNA_ID=CAMNT_0008178857 /DNA_START=431 /DNA_END=614 /DNA_ORIENTATION=-